MNKFRKPLITLTLISILGVSVYLGLLQLREKRLWPFNSGLSKILPPSFKRIAYNITSPDQKVVFSFLYKIKVAYFNIPDSGPVGGGAINNIGTGKALVTLNNGQLLIFDINTGNFVTIDSELIKKYLLVCVMFLPLRRMAQHI